MERKLNQETTLYWFILVLKKYISLVMILCIFDRKMRKKINKMQYIYFFRLKHSFCTSLLLQKEHSYYTHKLFSQSCFLYLPFFLGWPDITTYALHFRADSILTFTLQTKQKQASPPAIVYTVYKQMTQAQSQQWQRWHPICAAAPGSDRLCVGREEDCCTNNL